MTKVTICPPAPQTVFFQEEQFDDRLGGTDPQAYWRGQTPDDRKSGVLKGASKVKSNRLKKAKAALKGHENKDEIMKILRSDGR